MHEARIAEMERRTAQAPQAAYELNIIEREYFSGRGPDRGGLVEPCEIGVGELETRADRLRVAGAAVVVRILRR